MPVKCASLLKKRREPESNVPSTRMPPFYGCGFGCGSVAVLVTIRDMSRSSMVTVAGKKYCLTSVGSYQLVSLDHLQ